MISSLQLRTCTCLRADVNINSAYLGEIDTKFMLDEIYARKCHGPKLKLFKCVELLSTSRGVVPGKPSQGGGVDRWYVQLNWAK